MRLRGLSGCAALLFAVAANTAFADDWDIAGFVENASFVP